MTLTIRWTTWRNPDVWQIVTFRPRDLLRRRAAFVRSTEPVVPHDD